MNSISQVYRQVCRDIYLPDAGKQLLLKLLREISVNAVRRQKAWNIKEDFITLWFISVGRFPEFAANDNGKVIVDWVVSQLPFELTDDENLLLCS